MIDAQTFRAVLGNYPTGVCAITAASPGGTPIGMVVGSFSSVSLEPPLIGFFPDKRSTSWPVIEAAGKFCVNILAADQLDVCRQLAASGADKFVGLSHSQSGNGSPLLDNVIAWIDCDIHDVVEAGDHFLVLGLVKSLEPNRDADPLLFFKGRYGGFAHVG
jgi:3-hydroxy-9,10-secoandrosta-1,3,5(10)-triene-9,17-dione monooxygenase reductase component